MKALLLLAGHALCDYPLQGDFLSREKDRNNPKPHAPWYQALAAHALTHGGMVALVTGSTRMGIAETIIHAVTDDLKCRGKLSFDQDQAIHIGCKLLWAALARAHQGAAHVDQ